MNEKVRNHYLIRLGMAGEMLSMKAQERAPAPPTTAGDELRRMLSEGLIRYYRHEDRKRTYRICDPDGIKAIAEADPRLLEHAELLIGKKGARYSGSKQYRLKKRREGSLINAFLDAGFVVDGVGYDGNEHTFISGDLTSPSAIIKAAPPDTPLFLSGAVLKRSSPGSEHTRREMSISAGSIAASTGAFPVYIIATPRFRWYAASETQSALDVRRLWEDAAGKERSRDRRLKALLFAETSETAKEILKMAGREDSRMDPTTIFRLCYMTTLEDEPHAMDVARMLTIGDWKNKTNKALSLPFPPAGSDADGISEDGKPIYNLLCCNMGRIKELENKLRRGTCRVIVHDWQKNVLEELYGNGLDAVVLTAVHFRGLLIALEGLE